MPRPPLDYRTPSTPPQSPFATTALILSIIDATGLLAALLIPPLYPTNVPRPPEWLLILAVIAIFICQVLSLMFIGLSLVQREPHRRRAWTALAILLSPYIIPAILTPFLH